MPQEGSSNKGASGFAAMFLSLSMLLGVACCEILTARLVWAGQVISDGNVAADLCHREGQSIYIFLVVVIRALCIRLNFGLEGEVFLDCLTGRTFPSRVSVDWRLERG